MCRFAKGRPPVAGVILAAIVAICQGCGAQRMYEGDAKPRNQVARISDVNSIRTTVDGKPRYWRGGTFEVLPGVHSVAVTNNWGRGWEETRSVSFDAVAGATYRIRQDGVKEQALPLNGPGFSAIFPLAINAVRLFGDHDTEDDSEYGSLWITDQADGRVVGGRAPAARD